MGHFVSSERAEGSSHSSVYQRDVKDDVVSHYEQVTSEIFPNPVTFSTLLLEWYCRLQLY